MSPLPHEVEHAPGSANADHVEHDRLQRQQQRAECPCQQDERDDRDEGDHEREVSVDGIDEVLVLRSQAAQPHVSRYGVCG